MRRRAKVYPHATKNPGQPSQSGAPNLKRATSSAASTARHDEIVPTKCRDASCAIRAPPAASGRHAARNHNGCVAMRAPSPTIPGLPVTIVATITAADHAHTATAPRPMRARNLGAAVPGVCVAFAHPAAAKKTGIGANAAIHAHAGCRLSRFAPRSIPCGRSITASGRWPSTTTISARTRATSIASRRTFSAAVSTFYIFAANWPEWQSRHEHCAISRSSRGAGCRCARVHGGGDPVPSCRHGVKTPAALTMLRDSSPQTSRPEHCPTPRP